MELKPIIIYTDGKNEDFILLTKSLDQEFNDRFGIVQKQFDEFNTLEDIHDVVIMYDKTYPIACGSFKRIDSFTAEVKRVFVRKEYRRNGLSKILLHALEERGIEKEYKYFILETGKPLIEAIASYQSMGYEMIPNYEPYIGIDISVCMRKQILESPTIV